MENWQVEGAFGIVHSLFDQIISPENLFAAWREFKRGKMARSDVQEFEYCLEDHVLSLHEDLARGVYAHGAYQRFFVHDPKRRMIHKPAVRDRLLHHAVVRRIETLFERRFIFDTWSCRMNKGTHAAVERFQRFGWQLSRNNTRPVWVLKLDIRKFFENVNQEILMLILDKTIRDPLTMDFLAKIVRSFPKGIPLGNLTSQLFANVYLNELDQFVKNVLRIHAYLRYCDDFVLLHSDCSVLEAALPRIEIFLRVRLSLCLHSQKIILCRYSQGVDFLGSICYPHYRILRTKTKRRLLRRINDRNKTSYLGFLEHCRTRGIHGQALLP